MKQKPNKTFTITAASEKGKAVIRIDGYISDWNNHAAGFKSKLDQLIVDGIKDAIVYINSGGGDCFQANEIGNEISRFPGTLTAKLGALCASAGTYISSRCHHVIAAKNVSYMIHKPMAYFQGNSDEVKSTLKLLSNLEKEYLKTYSAKTGLSVDEIQGLWKEDYWMDSEEALAKGFIDEIEGEASITEEDIQAIASYKGAPKIAATATTRQPETKIEMKDKLLLIFASVLTATMTEAEITAQLEIIKQKAAKSDELEAKLKAITEAALKDKATAAVKAAIKDKKILGSQEQFFIDTYILNPEGTQKTLDAMPATQSLVESAGSESSSSEDRSKWTYADYQEKNPAALKELSENDPEKFEQLFNANYKKK